MNKLFLFAACITVSFFTNAQTCVGILSFRLVDQKTKKPIEKMDKNIWYVFTKDQQEFYEGAEPIYPLDTLLKEKTFTVRHNEQGYTYFTNPADKAMLSFPTHCGLYLVQTEFIRKNDTMRLAFYNIPAHQSFQIDTLVFKKGNYVVDFQGTLLMSELEFAEDKGYFIVPEGVIIPFPKKK